MITKFTTYITEGLLYTKEYKFEIFLKNYFKNYLKNTDFELSEKYNKYIIWSKINNDNGYHSKRIEFSYINDYYHIDFSDNHKRYKTLKELKHYLDFKLNDTYYKNMLNDCYTLHDIELENIIVLDRTEYSKFIYKLITDPDYKDKNVISLNNIYYKYLTDEYKEKIDHLINANNFDLI